MTDCRARSFLAPTLALALGCSPDDPSASAWRADDPIDLEGQTFALRIDVPRPTAECLPITDGAVTLCPAKLRGKCRKVLVRVGSIDQRVGSIDAPPCRQTRRCRRRW
jgi:hypothetical protein